MTKVPHVALLIETSRSYGRGLLRGVRRYVSENGPWSVFMELRALESKVPGWLQDWRGDGILTRTNSQAMADAIRATGVPAVEMRATRLDHSFPFIGVDNRALGRMVAEHLLECGFRNLAIYGIATEDYFEQRCENFIESARLAGCSCSVYNSPRGGGNADNCEKPANWEKQQNDVARWVSELPKPVGIMACTDQLGFWLLDACKRAGVAVPEEVAAVGVENDESLCMMSTPPLSSVRFDGERIGYEAAAMLQGLMDGRPVADKATLIKPLSVVTRLSSDVVALDEPDLADAVRFIREHACEGIAVEDVLGAVAVSRSWLERQMRDVLGRSPRAEIRRVQFNRVKELLCETGLSLAAIAVKTGFKHPQYMAEAFKREFGHTPGEFRAAAKKRQKS